MSLSSDGSFNRSVPNGTHYLIVSSSGYVSYYSNFTINSGNLKSVTIDLKPVSKSSSISNLDFYAKVGVVVAALVKVRVALLHRRKG